MINEENFVSAATDDIVISACTVELDENEKVLIDSKRNWQYYTTNKNGMLKERSGSYV